MDCFGFLNNNKKKKKEARGASERAGGAPVAPAAMTSMTSSASRSTASTVSQKGIPELYEEKAHNLRVFEFDELMNATNSFSRMNKIGEGGFGSVYRGYIKGTLDGVDDKRRMVAIKKLNQRSMQGHKQWLAEVQFLAVVEHPNLVKLLGYCAKDGERGIERLLVYEFMPNKSLEDHLFNRAYPVLPWSLRLQIALGVAEGLQYLHEGLEVQVSLRLPSVHVLAASFWINYVESSVQFDQFWQVIYRDFKASNVLLDNDFKPKLSDFGLAREGPAEGHTHVTTAVVGTYGYAAPDYVETGHLTAKSDVWSFGVVSFEILTGRRSLDRNRPSHEQKLLDWVRQFPIQSKKFTMIMDPRLRHEYSVQAAREMAKLANACLVKDTRERPSMSQVVERLRRVMRVEVEQQER